MVGGCQSAAGPPLAPTASAPDVERDYRGSLQAQGVRGAVEDRAGGEAPGKALVVRACSAGGEVSDVGLMATGAGADGWT